MINFYFSPTPLDSKSKFTKREVLSQIAKLFDPAGWLAPCIVIAKMLMQQIWLEKLDWNDSLSTFLFHKWSTFLKYFSNIRAIQIPRWVNFVTIGDVHFQCFCDASEKAFATDIYIRIRVSDSIHTYLLTAKSKVAPIKVVSLPRLELCGAVLMAEMADVILPELGIDQYDSFFWTDSTIVLACLRKSPCQWSTFVANRVSTILQCVGQAN